MPSDEEVTQRAGSLRSMTGLTEAEFMVLLPHFARALAAYLQDRTIDGQPRTSRRYRSYENSPLPTITEKLLFIQYLRQLPRAEGGLYGVNTAYAGHFVENLRQ